MALVYKVFFLRKKTKFKGNILSCAQQQFKDFRTLCIATICRLVGCQIFNNLSRVYSLALWPISITSKHVSIINSRVFVQRKGKLGLSLDQNSSLEPSFKIGLDFFLK